MSHQAGAGAREPWSASQCRRYPQRLLGCPPRRRNATVQESTRGRVSPRLRLACWCRTSSCCRPGSGLRLYIARQRHRLKGPAPPRHPALSVGAHVQLKCVVLCRALYRPLHIRLSSCSYATTLTAPTRSATGTRPRVALRLSSLADCKRERLAWRSLRMSAGGVTYASTRTTASGSERERCLARAARACRPEA